MSEDLYVKMAPGVYDAIYGSMKDYEAETSRLISLIRQFAKINVQSLLDVCCGTGRHLEHLEGWLSDLTGLDGSPAMLAAARRRLEGGWVKLIDGDMRNFRIDRPRDAVTCLFSAIAHLETSDELCEAVQSMSLATSPGGVAIVEPYIDPADFCPGNVSVERGETDGLKVVRVTRSKRESHINWCEMHHFVTCNGVHEEPFNVTLPLAMHTRAEITAAFEAAGLDVVYDEHGLMGRGLFIGRKPL